MSSVKTCPANEADRKLFSPLPDDTRDTLFDWLDTYISQPHPALGRSGAVCPFVAPSIESGSLFTLATRWVGADVYDMLRIMGRTIELFARPVARTANPGSRALVVVITDLPREQWYLVDEAHLLMKSTAVAQGIMLGQFHPECKAPAARNPLFPVNVSPFPLIAVRKMAFHDILFLHDNIDWFREYRRRYGRYYAPGRNVDPHFAHLYEKAQARDAQR